MFGGVLRWNAWNADDTNINQFLYITVRKLTHDANCELWVRTVCRNRNHIATRLWPPILVKLALSIYTVYTCFENYKYERFDVIYIIY
jgi:hypothetical protein